jgi:hypothetical protein
MSDYENKAEDRTREKYKNVDIFNYLGCKIIANISVQEEIQEE